VAEAFVIRHLKSGGNVKIKIRQQQLKSMVQRPQFALAVWLGANATEVLARQLNTVPEPSLLSLLGAGAVVGIIAYRIRNKK
jgi:hypothetical protein